MDNEEQQRRGADMVDITAAEVQEAWDLLHTALDYVPADAPPDVVNRVIGLVLATRNRNDVAAMHNMIVVNLAETRKRTDALIETTQALVAENIELRAEIGKLRNLISGNMEAEWNALTTEAKRKENVLIENGYRKQNNIK